ncbi:MAG: aminotransferase class IV [Alphaproteobacteria bacterium]
MSRFAFVNGAYQRMEQAHIGLEDRGFQFGDSIYEVIHFIDDVYIDAEGHLERLERSVSELGMPLPMPRHILLMHMGHLRKKNRIKEGFVYIQISRGEAPRNHLFPQNTLPTLVMIVKKQPFAPFEAKKVVTFPDIRWGRCDIKTTNLLPNVLVKQKAFEAGAFEGWMITLGGVISEGSLSNAWIVKEGSIYTAPTSCNILGGITRRRLIALADAAQIPVVEKSFTLGDAYGADEAFNSSSNAVVTPIVQINDRLIGSGDPGPISRRLYDAYMDFVEQEVKRDSNFR